MTHHQRHGTNRDLVEDQGVNADPEEEISRRPDDETGSTTVPPDPVDLMETEPDRRVGLPEQLPGYPGQQRSVDTS
ncbi:MAG: hypothetical protein ACJ72W_06535 [Actinoallomurus sp.]